LPEWLIERGIGETRCALIEDGAIVEARIEIDGRARAGAVIAARLTQSAKPTVAAADGIEFLLPRGAPGASEGALIAVEVTREPIPGPEPWKRPLARLTADPPHQAPGMDGRALAFPAPRDELGALGWDALIDEARTGLVRFNGGELRLVATPAMTLIDVDGFLPPEELAVRGAAEAASAIRRLDIGGSIGIDLPTSGSRVARLAAAQAIDAALPRPFERTAVNGFGFVQIVRPRTRASLIELAGDRASFEARALLRRAAFEPPGAKRLVAHPRVVALLEANGEWCDGLGQQLGGAIGLRAEPALPMSGGYAEQV
jgi:ribonuclease G